MAALSHPDNAGMVLLILFPAHSLVGIQLLLLEGLLATASGIGLEHSGMSTVALEEGTPSKLTLSGHFGECIGKECS